MGMEDDNLKRRLEALNGGPLTNLPEVVTRLTDPNVELQRKLTKPKVRPGDRNRAVVISDDTSTSTIATTVPRIPKQSDVTLNQAVDGMIRTTSFGEYYFVQRGLDEIAPWFLGRLEALEYAFGYAMLDSRRRRTSAANIKDAIFVDIETLGLSDEPLFLIGTFRVDAELGVVCEQFFARNLTEEASILHAFQSVTSESTVLITFNGMSFDLPYIRSRSEEHSVSGPKYRSHIDLLLEARKRVARQVTNCKLTTLETELCGRRREGDIPGNKIPAAYSKYLETGNASKISDILHHNVLDLVTTADLLIHFFGA